MQQAFLHFAGIEYKEVCMLKETYYMKKGFMETKESENEQIKQKEEVCYEYEGYRIRVYFSGEKTLTQCMKNLINRRMQERQ